MLGSKLHGPLPVFPGASTPWRNNFKNEDFVSICPIQTSTQNALHFLLKSYTRPTFSVPVGHVGLDNTMETPSQGKRLGTVTSEECTAGGRPLPQRQKSQKPPEGLPCNTCCCRNPWTLLASIFPWFSVLA